MVLFGMRLFRFVCLFTIVFAIPSPPRTVLIPAGQPSHKNEGHHMSKTDAEKLQEFKAPIESVDKNCYGTVLLTYETASSCPTAINGRLTSRLVMHGADIMLLNNVSQGTGLTMNADSEYQIGLTGSELYIFEDGTVILGSNGLCAPLNDNIQIDKNDLICMPAKVIPALLNILDDPAAVTFRRLQARMALYTCFFFFLLGICTAVFCAPIISNLFSLSCYRRPRASRILNSPGYVPLSREDSQISAAARHFFVAPDDLYAVEAIFDAGTNDLRPGTGIDSTLPSHFESQIISSELNGIQISNEIESGMNSVIPTPSGLNFEEVEEESIYATLDFVPNNGSLISSLRSVNNHGAVIQIVDESTDDDAASLVTCIDDEI